MSLINKKFQTTTKILETTKSVRALVKKEVSHCNLKKSQILEKRTVTVNRLVSLIKPRERLQSQRSNFNDMLFVLWNGTNHKSIKAMK